MTQLDAKLRKQLKQIAHHLDPVVSVADAGLTDTLVAETHRALEDHELIKVRLHSAERAERMALAEQLAGRCNAQVVQRIGKIAVLFRSNPQPKRALSNLLRYGLRTGG